MRPDPGARYDGGVFTIDLSSIRPMVAEPGDPTYGKAISELGDVHIDIAYSARGLNDPRNLVFPFYVIPDEGDASRPALGPTDPTPGGAAYEVSPATPRSWSAAVPAPTGGR